MKNYNLFLDDFRTPTMAYNDCINDPRFNKLHWVHVKSYKEFVAKVEGEYKRDAFPQLVAFDHDLAHEHYGYQGAEKVQQLYNNPKAEKTGYHAAKWLIEFVVEHKLTMPDVIIHTANTAGKANIKSLFDTYYKLQGKGLL